MRSMNCDVDGPGMLLCLECPSLSVVGVSEWNKVTVVVAAVSAAVATVKAARAVGRAQGLCTVQGVGSHCVFFITLRPQATIVPNIAFGILASIYCNAPKLPVIILDNTTILHCLFYRK
jgi:hypothetical protein